MGDVTDIRPPASEPSAAERNAHEPGGRRGRPKGRLSRAQLRHNVVTMTLAGASQAEIAEALGVTRSRVSRAVNRVLDEWEAEDRSRIEEVRELQLRRIDRLVRAHWNDALGIRDDGTSKPPSIRATEAIRKLEALRARIAGTEAPKKVEVTGELGLVIDAEEIDRLDAAWAGSGGDVIDGTAHELPPAELPAGS